MASIAAASTDGSIFPARRWHELYHAAIIELDSARLPGRIAEARQAILDRAREILTTSRDERYFLNDALRSCFYLRQLRREKNEHPKSVELGESRIERTSGSPSLSR
jgi:hypothetical protein